MITLYSTEGCHLCEQAFDLLVEVGVNMEQVDTVDIAFDDVLFSRYGVTIPVVANCLSELNWPFDISQLKNWLEDNGITYN
ncbi:glutaredoxin family protein [uncultured Aliivibrio sp.]|uniref:glutaredoxin family protein n=1 Tax=uncultured Aliivibrio sp. TaxID=873085 RepID=UPI00261A719E|nr:glutaredoxin family protein [uncultured Aliivibrio sp.]